MNLEQLCYQAREQSLVLQAMTTEKKNKMLNVMAQAILEHTDDIISANDIDIMNAKNNNRDSAFLDRLKLNKKRISDMAEGLSQVEKLVDPVGQITKEFDTASGLSIKKIRAPIGVVAIIYEARPNVTADAVGICIKSGNAVILKGSKDAHNSNRLIATVMQNALSDNGFDANCIGFVDDISRESTKDLLGMGKYIDVCIPRGGNGLKNFVLQNSTMPVIASAGGNCHIYVEQSANFEMAKNIIINAKCQRPSVCNALEQLLVDESIAKSFLPIACEALCKEGVKLIGDKESQQIFSSIELATEEDYYTERGVLILTIKVVKDYKEAIERINKYNTKHSDAIISENKQIVEEFFKRVDAACLYHNASTRFTDGFQFGFGAEMAISTQKLHVRGPMGLEALTSEKYIIEGKGNIRE